MKHTRRRSPSTRLIAVTLAVGQVLFLVPREVLAADATPAGAKPPAAPVVKVNRSTPRVSPPQTLLRFSEWPTDAEITGARVFHEVLIPTGAPTSRDDNRALAQALLEYRRRARMDAVESISAFLDSAPHSPWRASVLLNLGIIHAGTGRLSAAVESYREAWRLAKDEEEPARAIADRAAGDLAELLTTFGVVTQLEPFLDEVKGRTFRGSANQKISAAREGLWMLKHHHHLATPSARTALNELSRHLRRPEPEESSTIHASETGASLQELVTVAKSAGLAAHAVTRTTAAMFPVPSIVHLRIGHYSALLARDADRYLLRDPVLGGRFWITQEALADESSGFAMAVGDSLPAGWRPATTDETETVRGKCIPPLADKRATSPCNIRIGGSCGEDSQGMAQYDVHALLASLYIWDIPVGYQPPLGPSVRFRASYSQRESSQPLLFTYSNLGRNWTFDWLSYVEETFGPPMVYLGGGGSEVHDTAGPHPQSHAILVKTSTSPGRYERRLPDGSVEYFHLADGGSPPRYFLTAWSDPQDRRVHLTYDAQYRIVAVTDAIGQVTTLHYNYASDPRRVTGVTDPFGRSASIAYDSEGRLMSITDVMNMSSGFGYEGDTDEVVRMTTPYGSTFFRSGDEFHLGVSYNRWVEARDPLGARERTEYLWKAPVGGALNASTLYWDKRAMALHPEDATKARVITWTDIADDSVLDRPRWEKKPLEGRVDFGYASIDEYQPSEVSRTLDDGAVQIRRFTYNSRGEVASAIDPLGRETIYAYMNEDVDLGTIYQRNGAAQDRLASYAYNERHQPITYQDASGEITSFTYTATHQLETVTNALNETWTLTYDPQGHYLLGISGPAPGATLSFTWDGYGRPRTLTNMDNYTVTIDYDLLDRPTRVTYPNGTYEELVWDRMHPARYRDLLGLWTYFWVDALRRPTLIRDALNRTVSLSWCQCGGPDSITDGNDHTFRWLRDLQGRTTREIRADGTFMEYTYETTTSRLKQIRDPKLQTRQYEYFVDDRLKRVTYGGALPIPDLSLTYDPIFGRQATRTDGDGTTTYTYHPISQVPTLGAGRVATIDGPLPNDVVTYSYDKLNRVSSRSIGDAVVSATYDVLGRVAGVTNGLGTFTYTYDGSTSRLHSVAGPNQLSRTFGYFDLNGDLMLKDVTNQQASNLISKHSYTYSLDNRIATWTRATGASPSKRFDLTYDHAGQLATAVLRDAELGTLLKTHAYAYDRAGNRTSEQVDSLVTTSHHNEVNELTNQAPGGAVNVTGSTNEPATVVVQGVTAESRPNNTFAIQAPVSATSSTLTVQSTDFSHNTTTKTYQLTTTGSARTLSYDDAGNLTSDGARTYEWNVRHRLTAITQGVHRTEFTYDGFGRRNRIVEREAGTILSDKRYLWAGSRIVEERDASGNTTKRFFEQGVQQEGTNLYYTRDHLGSVREVVDHTGAVRARYDYDPYGRRTKTSGDIEADFGFTGHFTHAGTDLALAVFREYDAGLGRWLSRDPIGLAGGLNAYAYAGSDPIGRFDPLGLDSRSFAAGLVKGLLVGLAAGAALGALAALGPIAAAVALGIGIGMALWGLAAASIEYSAQCTSEDRKHELLGELVGGAIGGGIGGRGGHAAVKASIPRLGGAYGDVPANGGQVNHAPPNSVSPLPRDRGPGFRMEPEHHVQTASWGSSKAAKAWRAKQCRLIREGKFKEAQKMDFDDVRSKFGDLYDRGIRQAEEYTDTIPPEDLQVPPDWGDEFLGGGGGGE